MPLKCDFCDHPNPNPVFTIKACTFVVEAMPLSRSIGDWCACGTCYELAVAGKWDELAMRATRSYLEKCGTPKDTDVVFHFMRSMYDQLRVHLIHN